MPKVAEIPVPRKITLPEDSTRRKALEAKLEEYRGD
jgi:hypothetical protein|tara:strand:+ start:1622 stop:1729 length:108 start_codon:yes stop_codon:yes gene_type:complete